MNTSTKSDIQFFDGNARLSQNKVAELLDISQQSISKLVNRGEGYNLQFSESPKSLVEKGFDGYNLALVVEYYAFDSVLATKKTKQRCREIYRKAASKGFQDFINAVAGIEYVEPEIPQDLVDTATGEMTLSRKIQLLHLLLQFCKIGKDSVANFIASLLGIEKIVKESNNVALTIRANQELRQSVKQDVLVPVAIRRYTTYMPYGKEIAKFLEYNRLDFTGSYLHKIPAKNFLKGLKSTIGTESDHKAICDLRTFLVENCGPEYDNLLDSGKIGNGQFIDLAKNVVLGFRKL
jgi:hypothetical protein